MRMRGPTLLVIEDARDQAIVVGVAAGRAHPGLDVHTARDGREGIAYLSGRPPFQDRRSYPIPDLIILDLAMPGVDGFEVLEWIKPAVQGRIGRFCIPTMARLDCAVPVEQVKARRRAPQAILRFMVVSL